MGNWSLLLIIFVGLNVFADPSTKIKYNGITLEAPRQLYESDLLRPIKALNANYIAIVPYAFVDKEIAEVKYNYVQQWWGERPEGILHTIKDAKAHGLQVMIKPQLWVSGDGWPGEFIPNTKEKGEVLEETYTQYILYLASLAEQNDVPLFCIGTEFRLFAKSKPEYWIELIAQVRKLYSGKITYAANWDNYQNISFWSELDYIGIDAYFPLSNEIKPSVDVLKTAWRPKIEKLSQFSKQYDKQLLFTEYGYRSIQKAAGKHWELKDTDQIDMQEQVNGLIALYESVWQKDWFAGGFLWKWHLDDHRKEEIDNKFTPQGKMAEKTIGHYYSLYQ